LIGGPATKLPRDFAAFLMDSDNKRSLIDFICCQWQSPAYAGRLNGRNIYAVSKEHCTHLYSENGNSVNASAVDDLQSSQEKADTRIVLHCMYAANNSSSDEALVVRSPDTDVFVILIHYCSRINRQIFFDTGTGNNRRLIDVNKIASALGSDVTAALPAFHAFTGCDTVSAFFGKGKKRPFAMMRKATNHIHTFHLVGNSAVDLSSDVENSLEQFVCAMYGYPRSRNTGDVRYHMFQSRYGLQLSQLLPSSSTTGMDLSLLPPALGSLRCHCKRANYQAYIWTHAHISNPQLPSPIGCGWKLSTDNKLEIDWNDDLIMPQDLIDVLVDHTVEENTELEEEQSCEENDVFDNIIDFIYENEDDYDM